jgi:hypothetical protein
VILSSNSLDLLNINGVTSTENIISIAKNTSDSIVNISEKILDVFPISDVGSMNIYNSEKATAVIAKNSCGSQNLVDFALSISIAFQPS